MNRLATTVLLLGVVALAATDESGPHFDSAGGGGGSFSGDLSGNNLSDSSDSIVTISGTTAVSGMVRGYVGKDDGDSPYSTLATDYVIGGDTSVDVLTIDLTSTTVTAGRTVIVKDVGGNAGTNNITITTEGAETIDGAASFVINTNYESVSLVSDGTNWFIY